MHKLLSFALFLFSLSPSTLGCNVNGGIKLTNYGFPDASGTPAYKCQGNKPVNTVAGDKTLLGDGSFNHPYAAAAATGSIFKECDLIYVPLLKKYFRVQDNCSGCVSKQVDLYVTNSDKQEGQTGCEQQFGTFDYGKPLHEVVQNPGSGFETDTQPLFLNGKCFNKVSDGRVFPARDGKVTCAGNNAEAVTTTDVDGTADDVDNSGSQNDSDPAARHTGMKSASESGTGPQPTKAARAFRG